MIQGDPQIVAALQACLESLNRQGYKIDSIASRGLIHSAPGNIALRCGLNSDVNGMPDTVRLTLLDREAALSAAYTDWAALFFLSDLPLARGVAPEFFAADEEQGWFLTEDVQVMQQVDVDEAASLMAKLHAATWGRARIWSELRERLPLAHDALQSDDEEGAYRVLRHGSFSRRSLVQCENGPRLDDFGAARFGHALRDLSLAGRELGLGVRESRAFVARYRDEVLAYGLKWEDFDDEWKRVENI